VPADAFADCVNGLLLQTLVVGDCKFIVTGAGCYIKAFSRSQSLGGTFKTSHEKALKHQSNG
jgi:hypothetical protein